MSKQNLNPPRGTRDFYPEDFRLREWLFDHFRDVAQRYAFEEIDAPVVEHAELFMRKAGEEIVEQLYHFELHDRHLALRPEMTPSVARMVMARAGGLRFPLRWFSVTQNWRYERMTRGRKREHYQWNMDIWGEPGVGAEAELISACFQLFARVGLERTDVQMRVNSRALIEETLLAGPLKRRPDVFEPLCVVIDKVSKLGAEKVAAMLADPKGEVALSKAAAREVVDLLELRDLGSAIKLAPDGSKAAADLRALWDGLDAHGVADRVVFDASVVRGLAYYTGIVFEAFDSGASLRSICGGGRYDELLETLGGPSIPAVGFGFGDVVILELLSDKGRLPEFPSHVDDVVYAFTETERRAAIAVARKLRGEGRRVDLVLGSPKLKRVMSDADRLGAKRIWLLGPDEVGRGVARLRDLASGDESEESLPD